MDGWMDIQTAGNNERQPFSLEARNSREVRQTEFQVNESVRRSYCFMSVGGAPMSPLKAGTSSHARHLVKVWPCGVELSEFCILWCFTGTVHDVQWQKFHCCTIWHRRSYQVFVVEIWAQSNKSVIIGSQEMTKNDPNMAPRVFLGMGFRNSFATIFSGC